MFLNPIMLAGLGGALLPVVLHLLSRSRFRTVDWAAMMFLESADPRQRQSVRLKQWILLAVRMALVALLAIALARPIVSNSLSAVATGGSISAVIVVDGSASTGVIEAGRPRSDLIAQAAIRIVSALRPGDQAAVVVAGGATPQAPRLDGNLARVVDEINAIVPAGRADFADALTRARALLSPREHFNPRLFVVCDSQALSWRGVDDAFAQAWRKASDQAYAAGQLPGRSLPLAIVPVGQASGNNLAITKLALLNPPLVRDQPADAVVTIENIGPVARSGVTVAISANGRELTRAAVDVPPNGSATANLNFRYADAGPGLLTATLVGPANPGDLATDDSFDLAIEAFEPIKVLILSGQERTPASQSESFFAVAALQPFASIGRNGTDPCRVSVKPATAANPADLTGPQVVILANVARLSPVMETAIEQFVFGGGGLLIAPGGVSRLEPLNDRLASITPASIALPPTDALAQTLASLDTAHPINTFLHGRADSPAAIFGKAFTLTPKPNARVVASLSDNRPFAVETAVGRGRVLMLATPLDADFSTLPLSSFYLPFLQSSVRWLSGSGVDRNLSPHQPFVYRWMNQPRSAVVVTPDNKTVNVDVQRQGELSEVRFAGTDQPGVYRLKLTAGDKTQTISFVVQGARDESDLSPLAEQAWETLDQHLDAQQLRATPASIEAFVRIRQAREAWGVLLLAVMALAVGESWLAGRWSTER